MFSVFRTTLRSWRNRVMMARLQTSVPPRSEMEPHWWLAQPLLTPLPEMTFTVSRHAPLLDVYQTDVDIELFSAKLIDLLRDADVRFELFPAALTDYRSGETIDARYCVFHLLESYPCCDPHRTSREPLVLAEDRLPRDRAFFRVAEARQLVLIRHDLQRALEEANITGCQYQPLDAHRR